MIFYFSGTGNSYQAAKALLSPGEAAVDMAKCVWDRKYSFDLTEDEPLGFVCPVYYGGLPSVVREFIAAFKPDGRERYCWGVLTCGGSSLSAMEMLRSDLAKTGLALDACFSVTMPENYVIMFTLDSDEKIRRTLSAAERELKKIKARLDAREKVSVKCPAAVKALSRAMYPMYDRMRRTAKFTSDDQCIGCGTCAGRCPAHAIVMRGGRPKWIKERCIHCMACVRCGAVQYGKTTVGKKRYTNPILKKETKHAHH